MVNQSVKTNQDSIRSNRLGTINLGAGPCALPTSVLEQAACDLLDYQSSGLGVTEISHRSSAFQSINSTCQDDLRSLLSVPSNFEIIFSQGGGLLQFSTVVMNLVNRYRLINRTRPQDPVFADYLVTGTWSQKAADEAKRLGCSVNILTDSRQYSHDLKTFDSIPDQSTWKFGDHHPAFIYYCDNETVNGVEFTDEGILGGSGLPKNYEDVPIVVDMSSNILTRCIPTRLWDRVGVIFGGAQKNMGPSGLTVVVVRKDLMEFESDQSIDYGGFKIPSMLIYRNLAENQSLLNTPPMFSIYVCGLVFKELISKGGISFIEDLNQRKSRLVYDVIDSSEGGFYFNKIVKKYRSRMNVVFSLKGGKALEEKFIEQAHADGIKQIKGHRSVGGIRFSLYNAITLEQVESVCLFMKKFINDRLKQ
ncbi:pyridoxal phosphate-dependent transferase [Phakopsora pachyrhizi]|uniref:phosphoserine transaminase n=1 Tax=Phakopsora pachyrhizi TaxID=170000 RepID=A0AAV0BLU2_PHAPC|nr:pyridoxal phosphate-dependent transferase [Phakopsora pachyrhizi]